MSDKIHHYNLSVQWTGNKGTGTSSYRAYDRSHIISVDGRQDIPGSSDPSFRGDKTKYSPEDLLVASLSACHMLWFLHLCADAGVIVVDYRDNATGTLAELPDGSGHFTEVTLHPVVSVSEPSMVEKANSLHPRAHQLCFISSSCNFPVRHHPECVVAGN